MRHHLDTSASWVGAEANGALRVAWAMAGEARMAAGRPRGRDVRDRLDGLSAPRDPLEKVAGTVDLEILRAEVNAGRGARHGGDVGGAGACATPLRLPEGKGGEGAGRSHHRPRTGAGRGHSRQHRPRHEAMPLARHARSARLTRKPTKRPELDTLSPAKQPPPSQSRSPDRNPEPFAGQTPAWPEMDR